MSNDISVGAYNGRTNIVTDYALLMAGLEGNDTMDGAMGGSAGGRGSHAIMTGNLFRMQGGEGADWVRAGLPAGSSDEGVFTFRDNRVDVRGGCGDDTVGVWTDSLQVLFDNRITIDGGRGTDTVALDLTYASEGFNFDFSDGYNGRLTSGTRLKGFEAAEAYGGTGDDTFQGGRGNDIFDGGDGVDVVILDGERCDYEVTRLDEGGMQITDLRQGCTGGTDLYDNVEAFVFDNGFFDLT